MSSSKLTCVLHMLLEIPELFQANIGNIHNVVGLGNRSLAIWSVGNARAKWHGELDKVFIQREQSYHFRGNRTRGLCILHGFFVCGHALAVQMSYLEDVDGNPTFISPTRPLRVLKAESVMLCKSSVGC